MIFFFSCNSIAPGKSSHRLVYPWSVNSNGYLCTGAQQSAHTHTHIWTDTHAAAAPRHTHSTTAAAAVDPMPVCWLPYTHITHTRNVHNKKKYKSHAYASSSALVEWLWHSEWVFMRVNRENVLQTGYMEVFILCWMGNNELKGQAPVEKQLAMCVMRLGVRACMQSQAMLEWD